MPERDYQLEERLEALVRFSAPGEFGNGFYDHESDPAKVAPAAIVAGRRRKNSRSGGVLFPRDSTASWAVNIRPKNWGNKDKIWMGKIKSMEEAQRIADIVFHYLGCGPVHFLFPDGRQLPPPFLNDNLRVLDSVEKRMRYVKHIAKGDEFHSRRKELMDSVKEMVKHLAARQDEVANVSVVDPLPDPFIAAASFNVVVDHPFTAAASFNVVDHSFTAAGASFNVVDHPFTAAASFSVVDPFTATCNIRSPPELGVERFDEAYGRRALSFDFPVLLQDEIELMMSILMPDYPF